MQKCALGLHRLSIGTTASNARLDLVLDPGWTPLPLPLLVGEVVASGRTYALGPFPFPSLGARSIQGQLPLLPLVLVGFRGYASISPLPDRLQASIPSAGLALARGAACP